VTRLVRFVILILALTPFPAAADQSLPDPRTSMFGPGRDDIDWAEATVKGNLRYIVGEPGQTGEVPIVVQNIGDEPIENLRLRIVWRDGNDRSVDEAAWVYPKVLKPGQFGITGGSNSVTGSTFPMDFGEISVYPVTTSDPIMDGRRTLKLQSGHLSDSGRFEASVINTSNEDVQNIWVHWICVERSGFVVRYGYDAINDIRVLRAGDKEQVVVRLNEACADGYLIDAEGMVRD